MSEYSVLESGFNSSDETINFGARNIADGQNLYEASTVASYKSSEEVQNAKFMIKNRRLFFSVNKTLKIFEDLHCTELLYNATIDDIIQTFCVTDDGKFSFLCLKNGNCMCISVENNLILYTGCFRDVAENEHVSFIATFVESSDDNLSFLIVASNGKVFRVATRNCSENLSINGETSNMEFQPTVLIDLNDQLKLSAFNGNDLLLCGDCTYVYDVEEDEVISTDSCNFKKVHQFGKQLFLGLDDKGNFVYICSKTLLIRTIDLDVVFDDIAVLMENNDIFIYALTERDELGNAFIQLLSLPDYELVFSIKILKGYLVIPHQALDEYMYISEVKSTNEASEFRFQLVSETLPEKRLIRLLRRQKFKEAEEFALLYDLDVDQINKAKAEVIINKLECDETDVRNLLNILDCINDDIFKLEACLNTHLSCSSLEDVRKILMYGCSLPLNQNCDNEVQELYSSVCSLMFRFGTFTLFTHEDTSLKEQVEKWVDFSTADLINECIMKLKYRRIEESIIIYNRLDTETLLRLKEDSIEDILKELEDIPEEKFFPFLHTFIPISVTHVPPSLPLFVEWLRKRVFYYEQHKFSDFPDAAIEFANKFIDLLKVKDCANIRFQQQCNLRQDALNNLSELLQALQRIQLLNNTYKITLNLKDCLEPPKSFIRILLNIALPGENYQLFLEDFLTKVMLDNHLIPDEIFLKEIKDIVKYQETYWIKIVPSILNSIHSLDLKLEAIHTILKSAKIPWNNTVRDIAKKGSIYDHPIAQKIISEIEYEPKCVILRKKPYELTKVNVNTIDKHKFAISRIIYCNQPEMVEDIYCLCKDSDEKHEATMKLADHFIQTGMYKDALNVLDNYDDSFRCCKKLIDTAILAINDKYKLPNLAERYYDTLGSLFTRVEKNSSSMEKKYLKQHLENIRSVFKLNNYFHIGITVEEFENGIEKNIILEKLLSATVKKFKNGEITIQECFKEFELLVWYFNLNKSLLLVKICEKLDDFNFLAQAVKKFLVHETEPENACKLAVLLLRSLDSFLNQPSRSNESYSNQTSTDLCSELFELIGKSVFKSIANCEGRNLPFCLDVANWLYFTYYLKPQEKKFISKSVYYPEITLFQPTFYKSIRNIFDFYVRTEHADPLIKSTYLMNVSNISLEVDSERLKDLSRLSVESINAMCAEGHILIAYKLIATLQNGISKTGNLDVESNSTLDGILQKCTLLLLQKLFAARYIDTDLVLNLLLYLDAKTADNFMYYSLRHYKRNVQKFRTVAYLYLQFQKHHNITTKKQLCANIILLAKWWDKLDPCQIPYDEFFKILPNMLAKRLIDLNHLDIVSLQEYCLDFDLSVQEHYLVYLNKLLTNWKPECDIEIGSNDQRKIIIRNTEIHLYDKCKEVIDVITNREAMTELIIRSWDAINFYYYEVFLCILKVMEDLKIPQDPQRNHLLIFLKNYKRVSKPGQAELEQWYTAFPEKNNIDFLCESRLPFTSTLFTKDIWNIIRPELNLKTYRTWFTAISILPRILSKDDICTYVVKAVVASGELQNSNPGTWNLHVKHGDLFDEVDKCVQNISNLELATSAVYHLSTHTPPGADQVNAIKLCYKYAQQYKEQNPEASDVLKAFIKVEKKFYSFSVMHILHKHQLTDTKYMDMVSAPFDELIDALYMDERILLKAKSVRLECPDINSAIDELATLYGIDVLSKRIQRVKLWLSSDSSLPKLSLEMSLYSSALLNENATNLDVTSENLIRAAYVCTSGDKNFWQNHLLKIVDMNLNDSTLSETKQVIFKARALECLCSISDGNTVEQLTHSTYEDIWNYINKLYIVSDLEHFGFALCADSLDQYNKDELLRQLSLHTTNVSAVKIMALICVTYNIFTVHHWEQIINAMINLKMVKELKEYLFFLRDQSSIQYKKSFIRAWQIVINNIFSNVENSSNESLIESFHLLQLSPIVFLLELESIMQNILQMGKYDFAALLLQYFGNEKQTAYAKKIINGDKNVIRHVKDLEQLGFTGISKIVTFLERMSNGVI